MKCIKKSNQMMLAWDALDMFDKSLKGENVSIESFFDIVKNKVGVEFKSSDINDLKMELISARHAFKIAHAIFEVENSKEGKIPDIIPVPTQEDIEDYIAKNKEAKPEPISKGDESLPGKIHVDNTALRKAISINDTVYIVPTAEKVYLVSVAPGGSTSEFIEVGVLDSTRVNQEYDTSFDKINKFTSTVRKDGLKYITFKDGATRLRVSQVIGSSNVLKRTVTGITKNGPTYTKLKDTDAYSPLTQPYNTVEDLIEQINKDLPKGDTVTDYQLVIPNQAYIENNPEANLLRGIPVVMYAVDGKITPKEGEPKAKKINYIVFRNKPLREDSNFVSELRGFISKVKELEQLTGFPYTNLNFQDLIHLLHKNVDSNFKLTNSSVVSKLRNKPSYQKFTDTQLNTFIEKGLALLPYHYGKSLDDDGNLKTFKKRVNSLYDFYSEVLNEYTTDKFEEFLNSKRERIKDMFKDFGVELTKDEVEKILNTNELLSGNVIANIARGSLGLNDSITNELFDRKKPKPDMNIMVNGRAVKFKDLRDAFDAVRKEITEIPIPIINSIYQWNYAGTEGYKTAASRKAGKVRADKKGKFEYTFRLNRNTIGITNTITENMDFEQTNGLVAGKGTLANEINSFVISQKNVDESNPISQLFFTKSQSDNTNTVIPKSLFPTIDSIERSFNKHNYATMRNVLNNYFNLQDANKLNFVAFVQSNVDEIAPTDIVNKKGRLSLNFDLNDPALFEITKLFFEEQKLFDTVGKKYLDEAIQKANQLGLSFPEGANSSKYYFEIQKELLNEALTDVYIPITTLEYFSNSDNYQNGEWKRSEDRPGFFPRQNVTKTEWESTDTKVRDAAFEKVFTTYNGISEGEVTIAATTTSKITSVESKATIVEKTTTTENEVKPTTDYTDIVDDIDEIDDSIFGNNTRASSAPINENTILDMAQAFDYARTILPSLNEEELVFLTRQAFNNKFNEDWNGAYKDGFLYFASDGTVGKKLLRHEVFHKIFNEFLTEDERNQLKQDFAGRFFKNTFNLEMKDFEEALTIAYQEHKQNPQNTPTGIRGIIQKIVNFFNKLFGRTDELEDFFDKVDRGEFSTRRSEPDDNIIRASSRLVDLAGGVEKYNDIIDRIRGHYKTVTVDGFEIFPSKFPSKLFKLPAEVVVTLITKDIKSQLLAAMASNNKSEEKRLRNIAREIDTFVKEAIGQDLNIKSLKLTQDNVMDPEESTADDQDQGATIQREILENDEIKVFDIASENVKLFLANLYTPFGKKIPISTAFAVAYKLFDNIKNGSIQSIIPQIENNKSNIGSSVESNTVFDSIIKLLESNNVNNDLNKFNFKFLDNNTIVYATSEEQTALLQLPSYLIDPNELNQIKRAPGETFNTFIARSYDELKGAFGESISYTKSKASSVPFTTTLIDELQYKSNSAFNSSTSAAIISFFSSLRERNIYVAENRKSFASSYQKFANRSQTSVAKIQKNYVKNNIETVITNNINNPEFFISLKNIIASSIGTDDKINSILNLFNLESASSLVLLNIPIDERNNFLSDLKYALFLNNNDPLTSLKEYLFKKVKINQNITKGNTSKADSSDESSTEGDITIEDTRNKSISDLMLEQKMDYAIEFLAATKLLSEPLKLSSNVRSLNGQKSESRMVRNSSGFANIQALSSLRNLSGDLLFFDTKHFKLNPFVRNTGWFKSIVDIPGKKTFYQNGKEKVTDTIQLKYTDTEEFNFMYLFLQTGMMYQHKNTKEGVYVQKLHQQGDSKKPKGVEVKILNDGEIKDSIGAIVDQFIALPDEIAEINWKKKNLNSFMYLNDAAKELGVEISSANRSKLINKVIDLINKDAEESFKLAFENIPGKRIDIPSNIYSIIEMFTKKGFITPLQLKSLERELKEWVSKRGPNINEYFIEEEHKNVHSFVTTKKDENGKSIEKDFLFDKPELRSILLDLFKLYSKNYAVNSHHLIEIALGSPAALYKNNETIMKRLDSVFSPGMIGAIRSDESGVDFARESVNMGVIQDHTIEINFKESILNTPVGKNFDKITNDDIEWFTNNIANKKENEKLSSEDEARLKSITEKLYGKKRSNDSERQLVLEALDFAINNRLSERFWLKSLGLEDDDITKLLKNRGTKGYNPSDGQGFHLPRRNKELVNSFGDPSIKGILKPLYVGTEIINGIAVPRIIKYSSIELTDELVAKYPKLAQLRENMEKLNLDEVVMDSALKASSVSNPFGSDELFSPITNLDIKNRSIKMYSNKYKLQLNPYSASTTVRDLSQIKYFFNDQISNVEAGKQLYAANAALLRERQQRYFNRHILNKNGTANYSKIKNTIRNGVLSAEDIKGFDRPVYLYSKFDKNSTLPTPWNAPIIRPLSETSLLNAAHNAVKKVNFPGKKAVLQSTFGITNYNGPISETDLQYRVHKNVSVGGNLVKQFFAADAVVPKEFIPSDVREKFLKDLQEWKDGGRIGKQPELFIGFGIRIPTTGAHSAMALRVVDVYDDKGTNVVIVPHQIVQIAGSDYDVDSLFMIRYNQNKYDIPSTIKINDTTSINLKTSVSKDGIVGQTYDPVKEINYGLKYNYNSDNERIESGFLKNLYNDIKVINDTLDDDDLTIEKDIRDSLIDTLNDLYKLLDDYYQNVMVDIYLKEFGNTDNLKLMTDIINMDKVKNWLKSKGYDGVTVNPTSTKGAYIQTAAATSGIYGTGISANLTKLFAYLIKAGVNGNPAILKKEAGVITRKYQIGVPVMVKEGQTALTAFDSIEVNSKSREEIFFDLEALVNLCIDNIKELQLMGLNLNDTSIWWYGTLRMLGMDFDTLNKIFISPVMKYITSYSDFNFTEKKLQSIIDMEKIIRDKNIQLEDITDALNSYKATDEIPTFEELVSDENIGTTASILQLISSAAYIVNGSPTVPGIRKLIPLIDSLRIKQNTYYELRKVYDSMQEIFKDDGSTNFVFDIPGFLPNLPHIKQALQYNTDMKNILERTIMVRHPNVRALYGPGTTISKITFSFDEIENQERKTDEAEKFLISQIIGNKNYPPLKINGRIYYGNDAFSRLLIERHTALYYALKNITNSQPVEFEQLKRLKKFTLDGVVYQVTKDVNQEENIVNVKDQEGKEFVITKEVYDQMYNDYPRVDNTFLDYISSEYDPNLGVSRLEFENSYLEENPGASKEVEESFMKINHFKEVFDILDSEGNVIATVDTIDEVNNYDPQRERIDEEGNTESSYSVKPRFEYIGPNTGEKYNSIQRDYFDYAAINEGLKPTVYSIGTALPFDLHREFTYKYLSMMHGLIKRNSISFSNNLSDMFNIAVAVNYSAELANKNILPIKEGHRSYTGIFNNTPTTFTVLKGFDVSTGVYYDLKVKIPNYDQKEFQPSTLDLTVKYNGNIYYRVGYNIEEGNAYYAKLGKASSYGIYDAVTNIVSKYSLFSYVDTFDLKKLGKKELIEKGKALKLELDDSLDIIEMQERIIIERLKSSINSAKSEETLNNIATKLNMVDGLDMETSLAAKKTFLKEKLDNAEYDAISPLSVLQDRRIPHIRVGSELDQNVTIAYNPHIDQAFENKDEILVYAAEESDIFELNAKPIVLQKTDNENIYRIVRDADKVKKLDSLLSNPGNSPLFGLTDGNVQRVTPYVQIENRKFDPEKFDPKKCIF
jgi:hypothetical protein